MGSGRRKKRKRGKGGKKGREIYLLSLAPPHPKWPALIIPTCITYIPCTTPLIMINRQGNCSLLPDLQLKPSQINPAFSKSYLIQTFPHEVYQQMISTVDSWWPLTALLPLPHSLAASPFNESTSSPYINLSTHIQNIENLTPWKNLFFPC